MVISSELTESTTRATACNTSLQPQRSGLKSRKRRGLSAFYFNKSQSFNCIRDLQANPFCQSALVLAKPATVCPAWQQPFCSIPEDRNDVAQQDNECIASSENSWSYSEPGSPITQDNITGCAWRQCSDGPQQMQLGILSAAQDMDSQSSTSCSAEGSNCPLLTFGSTSSPSSSMDVNSACTERQQDGNCVSLYQQVVQDSLCEALRSASLASRRSRQLYPMPAVS